MAILRKDKKGNYTVIDNGIFKDANLSLKAKGLLCLMLHLPDDWTFSVAGLARYCKDGRDSITSTLNELKEAGYFRREQKTAKGKFDGVEYVISETKFAEKPFTENPKTEKPITENPTLLNTNIPNTKRLSTKDIYSGLDGDFVKALKDFEEMRKRIKAPLTDRSRQMLLNKLERLAGDDTQKKIAILEQSIFNSWKGVFEIDSRRSDQERRSIRNRNGRSEDPNGNSESEWGSIPRA